MFSENNTEAN